MASDAVHLVRVIYGMVDFTPDLVRECPHLNLACGLRFQVWPYYVVDASVEVILFLPVGRDVDALKVLARLIVPRFGDRSFD